MSDFCNAVENNIVNSIVGNGTLTKTTSLKLHLHTADPGEAGTSNEVVGGTYTEQTIVFGAPGAGASGRKVENTGALTFNLMPAVTVTHWTVKDAATTIWVKGAFGASVAVPAGGDFDVAIGDIDVEANGDAPTFTLDGILNAFRGNANWTVTTCKVTLCTGDPGTGVVANEVGGITRQTVSWNAASDGVITNNGAITWPTVGSATASWACMVRDSDGQVVWTDDIADQTDTDFRITDTSMSVTVD